MFRLFDPLPRPPYITSVQVIFVVDTIVTYYCIYYEYYLNRCYYAIRALSEILFWPNILLKVSLKKYLLQNTYIINFCAAFLNTSLFHCHSNSYTESVASALNERFPTRKTLGTSLFNQIWKNLVLLISDYNKFGPIMPILSKRQILIINLWSIVFS